MTDAPDRAGVVAPPPLIIAAFLGIGWGLQKLIPIAIEWPGFLLRAATPLMAGGALIVAWSLIQFAKWKTSPDPFHPTKQIISTGPFRFSRNPIYVGFLLLHLGFALRLASPWMVLTLIPSAVILHRGVVLREEKYLERKFGEVYLNYKTIVRRWI